MSPAARRRTAGLAALLLLPMTLVALLGSTEGGASATTAFAANGTRVSLPMRRAVGALVVHGETPRGYDRDLFRTWTDQDHDCRNTRAEVLATESRGPVTGRCTISGGTWFDWYDDIAYRRASQLDIDHLVPLAEVWASGARGWSAARRQAYANDLGDARTLVAVSLHTNRSKGDQEPDQWVPIRHACRYVANWVAVKTRWSMTIDPAEKADLLAMATHCGNPTIRIHRAVVRGGVGSGGSSGASTGGSSGGSSGGDGLDPRFSTCTEAKAHGYGPYYRGRDPEYSWYRDADSDGIVCE